MAATNGPDNSLERIIVLYQQELHNKLQSLNTIQQRYQLLNSQLQQLNKQEDQSYAVVRKATALRQKSLALIDDIKDPPGHITDNNTTDKLCLELTVQTAFLNAYKISLMRALTYESLVDTENKYSIAKAEKDIISGQLAILKKFAKATKYYQQLSSLLEQQKKLAENIQQSSNANQLLEHLQQQLPSEIAQIEQQINNYQRQLATAQRQTSDIAQNYAQALSKYQMTHQQHQKVQQKLRQAQQTEKQINQQSTLRYDDIFNKCDQITKRLQKKSQQLQQLYEHKKTLLQSIFDKRQKIKQELENAASSRKMFSRRIEQAKIAQQKVTAIQSSSKYHYSPESDISIQVALLKIDTEINKAYLNLDKINMQIKGLLSQSLALGEDITQLQKELPAINQNIITVNNNYQQITSYIEQQKTLANKKYRQIIEQAAANTTAAQEKVNIAKISSENAQKEVYRLRFALLIANYYQQILQDKYRKDNDYPLENFTKKADKQIDQKYRELSELWDQYQQLTDLISPQWKTFNEELGNCWANTAQVHRDIDHLQQIIDEAKQKLQQAREETDQLLMQQQRQQQATNNLLIDIQAEKAIITDEQNSLTQTARKLISSTPKIPIVPDTPYIATIPKTTISQIYALALEEPIYLDKPQFNPADIKQSLRRSISKILSDSAFNNANSNNTTMPSSESNSIYPQKKNSNLHYSPTETKTKKLDYNNNEMDIAFEQEVRKRILADLNAD